MTRFYIQSLPDQSVGTSQPLGYLIVVFSILSGYSFVSSYIPIIIILSDFFCFFGDNRSDVQVFLCLDWPCDITP